VTKVDKAKRVPTNTACTAKRKQMSLFCDSHDGSNND